MSKPNARDIADTCVGLSGVSQRLRDAANGKPVEGTSVSAVLCSSLALLSDAEFLDTVAEELRRLIPESPIELGED